MGIEMQENRAVFTGVVYEDEIVPLRDYLQATAPEEVVFDMSGCDDIHLGILQVMLAYSKMYGGNYLFPSEPKPFQKVCEGFERSDVHCA